MMYTVQLRSSSVDVHIDGYLWSEIDKHYQILGRSIWSTSETGLEARSLRVFESQHCLVLPVQKSQTDSLLRRC